jgi:hypothetical protein
VIAYKFLREGAVAPFTGVKWPVVGEWLRAGGELELCGNGVHACRPEDLPMWLFDELWELELEPPIRSEPTHVIAAAGRLRARVESWGPDVAGAFAAACTARVRDPAYALDAATWGKDLASKPDIASADAACVAFIAAEAARSTGGDEAAAAERRWQAEWLAGRLGIARA